MLISICAVNSDLNVARPKGFMYIRVHDVSLCNSVPLPIFMTGTGADSRQFSLPSV